MQLINFNYVDTKGKQSHRELAVIQKPSDKYFGYDVSEFGDEQVAEFALEYDRLYQEFQNKVEVLVKYHDMKYNYRTFLEKSMSDVVVEEV